MIVTLLSDFGLSDHYVAAMKGAILSRAAGVSLVDISHDVPPHDIRTAAYLLLCCYPDFPPMTVHLVVVDPGVGSDRLPIVVRQDGRFLVGPDNGVFSYVLEEHGGWDARVIENADLVVSHPSTTFHGRDVFAPTAAALAAGLEFEAIGRRVTEPERLESIRSRRTSDGTVEGRILQVDRFGNLVTNLRKRDVGERAGPFAIQLGDSVVRELRTFYGQGEPGEPFMIWGSGGFLEVSVALSSAAARLAVGRGDPVRLVFG